MAALDWITLKLNYRPPYDWDQMMAFFRARAIPSVEWVDSENVYRRTLRVNAGERDWIGFVEAAPLPKESCLRLRVSGSLEAVLPQLTQRVRTVFDLDAVPEAFPEGIDPGIRLPGCFDGFEMSLRAVIGQQVTVKAATTLIGRLANHLGEPVASPWPELSRVFPEPECFVRGADNLEASLGSLGIIRSRSACIRALAELTLSGTLSFEAAEGPEQLIGKLTGVKGIGIWTAQYIAMRGLSCPDVFLKTDLVVKQNLLRFLKDEEGRLLSETAKEKALSAYQLNKAYEREADRFAEAFSPWRSYLTLAIWRGLSWEADLRAGQTL